jgi:chitin disaccharide deacetylase
VSLTVPEPGHHEGPALIEEDAWVQKRELIINVDDIGIHSGAVASALETIIHGVAASGSVMVVCPGSAAALELLASHPEVPVGVHLTLTADFPQVPWSPLTAGPSIQEHGLLLGIGQRDRLLAQADAHEVEAEFRAQIEVLLEAGVQPTHLDWHCLADGGREDIFDLTSALAEEYRTGVRAWTDYGRAALRKRGLTVQNRPFLDSFGVPLQGKQKRFREYLRTLPEGLSEWAVHPAQANAGDSGSDVRTTDYDVLMAPGIRQALADECITVLGNGDPRFRGVR